VPLHLKTNRKFSIWQAYTKISILLVLQRLQGKMHESRGYFVHNFECICNGNGNPLLLRQLWRNARAHFPDQLTGEKLLCIEYCLYGALGLHHLLHKLRPFQLRYALVFGALLELEYRSLLSDVQLHVSVFLIILAYFNIEIPGDLEFP